MGVPASRRPRGHRFLAPKVSHNRANFEEFLGGTSATEASANGNSCITQAIRGGHLYMRASLDAGADDFLPKTTKNLFALIAEVTRGERTLKFI